MRRLLAAWSIVLFLAGARVSLAQVSYKGKTRLFTLPEGSQQRSYRLVTPARPLRATLRGPGLLAIFVRQHLRPNQQRGIALSVEIWLNNKRYRRVVLRQKASQNLRYQEQVAFRPSQRYPIIFSVGQKEQPLEIRVGRGAQRWGASVRVVLRRKSQEPPLVHVARRRAPVAPRLVDLTPSSKKRATPPPRRPVTPPPLEPVAPPRRVPPPRLEPVAPPSARATTTPSRQRPPGRGQPPRRTRPQTIGPKREKPDTGQPKRPVVRPRQRPGTGRPPARRIARGPALRRRAIAPQTVSTFPLELAPQVGLLLSPSLGGQPGWTAGLSLQYRLPWWERRLAIALRADFLMLQWAGATVLSPLGQTLHQWTLYAVPLHLSFSVCLLRLQALSLVLGAGGGLQWTQLQRVLQLTTQNKESRTVRTWSGGYHLRLGVHFSLGRAGRLVIEGRYLGAPSDLLAPGGDLGGLLLSGQYYVLF